MTKEERRERTIARLEKERSRPKTNFYAIYIIFIISLIYTVDEIASQIGMIMKTEIANDLFARFGESSVSAIEVLGIVGMLFQLCGLFYRPLADRWGRKLFLVINTFGMSLALLIIFLSKSIAIYFIASLLVQFFVPHDMHVVYIMETAPAKHRAKIYSVIKFTATIGVMIVPLLRRLLMETASDWRNVYMIPAVAGLITSFIALLFAKEPTTFIDSRISYLKMSDEEKTSEKRNEKDAQGGLITALKFAFKNKQLRWLYIVTALINIGYLGTVNYQVIMSYAFAEGIYGSFSEDIMNEISIGPVTSALLLFPVGCAVSQLIIGFISDSGGRKHAAIATASISVISFLGFFFGAKNALSPFAVGLLAGAFIGGYYSLNDVIIMMIGESSPTNLRSSAMSAQFIVTAAGVVISYGVGLPLISILGNRVMGIVSFCLLVPGFIAALLVLMKFTRDTKATDLSSENIL